MHILDLVQNSIEANANEVLLEIIENNAADTLTIRVNDDGRGMDEATIRLVRDPFVTTRATRKVGLGLPLIDMSATRCDGYLKIESSLGKGTLVEAVFRHSHFDRPPLGNMVETIKSLVIANPKLDLKYRHIVNGNEFQLSTFELTANLGDVPLSHPDVILWLHDYLTENLANLYGGVQHENN